MKKTIFNSFLLSLILFITLSCSNKEKSVECTTFLECLDGTYWTTDNNKSIWTFNDKKNGEYLEVYISGDNCYTYENNFIVNDSIIEKTKSTGGNTSYFYKTDKNYLDKLLELDECTY